MINTSFQRYELKPAHYVDIDRTQLMKESGHSQLSGYITSKYIYIFLSIDTQHNIECVNAHPITYPYINIFNCENERN